MPDNLTNYVINNGFAAQKIKHMKRKNLAIHLILISFLSVLLPACGSFQKPADAELKPIKVTLLNSPYSNQAVVNTRQTVNPNTRNSPSPMPQGAPVRLDNVAPPAYYTGNTDDAVSFTTPSAGNTPSEVRLQPTPATEFNFPSDDDSREVSSTPASSPPITAPPATVPNNSVIVDNAPPPAITDADPDPIAAVLAAQQPASTNDSDTAVSVSIETPADAAPDSNISTLPPPIAETPVNNIAEAETPAVIPDNTSNNTASTIADSSPPPVIVDTQAPVQNNAPQEVATGVVAAEPSLSKLSPAEQAEAEQTVENLIAQSDLAAMTAYINQYELDFGRYPYVQRVRVVRDQRCRENAVSFLSKGQTAFMEAYGQWCPRSSFTQAAR